MDSQNSIFLKELKNTWLCYHNSKVTALLYQILLNHEQVQKGNVSRKKSSLALITLERLISYQVNDDYFGSDIFEYTVSDIHGAVSNTASVSINISGNNDAPRTVDDEVTTEEDESIRIKVLDNDEDIDGTMDVTSVALVVMPKNGSVEIQSDGSLIYTPNKDFFGLDTFTYTVKDNENALSNEASVNVSVTSINDAPIAVNDTVVLKEDIPLDNELFCVSFIHVEPSLSVRPPMGKSKVIPRMRKGTVIAHPQLNFHFFV